MSEMNMSYMIGATEKILNSFLIPKFTEIEEIKVTPYSDDRVQVLLKVKKGNDLRNFKKIQEKIKSIVPMIGGVGGDLSVPDSNEMYYYLACVVFFRKKFR